MVQRMQQQQQQQGANLHVVLIRVYLHLLKTFSIERIKHYTICFRCFKHNIIYIPSDKVPRQWTCPHADYV